MPKDTQFQKDLSEATEIMQGLNYELVRNRGGYPADWNTVPGFVLCADVRDEDEPELRIYRNADVVAALRTAKRDLDSGRCKDMAEAFYENYPPTRGES
ncbi:hypothetical protein EON83_12415 [bacterium]|nr:MAG: hypothetical protein EON83_12415 [bacterium]